PGRCWSRTRTSSGLSSTSGTSCGSLWRPDRRLRWPPCSAGPIDRNRVSVSRSSCAGRTRIGAPDTAREWWSTGSTLPPTPLLRSGDPFHLSLTLRGTKPAPLLAPQRPPDLLRGDRDLDVGAVEGITNGIEHGGRGPDGAGLTDPLRSQWIGGGRRHRSGEPERRQRGGGRHQIVHQ